MQPEGSDTLDDLMNPGNKRVIAALGDSNIRNLHRGEILQPERKVYFGCDVPVVKPAQPAVVLIEIPDGRQR